MIHLFDNIVATYYWDWDGTHSCIWFTKENPLVFNLPKIRANNLEELINILNSIGTEDIFQICCDEYTMNLLTSSYLNFILKNIDEKHASLWFYKQILSYKKINSLSEFGINECLNLPLKNYIWSNFNPKFEFIPEEINLNKVRFIPDFILIDYYFNNEFINIVDKWTKNAERMNNRNNLFKEYSGIKNSSTFKVVYLTDLFNLDEYNNIFLNRSWINNIPNLSKNDIKYYKLRRDKIGN